MCVCLLFIFKTRERKREIEILNVSNKNMVMLMSVFKVLFKNLIKESFYEKRKKQLMFWQLFLFLIKSMSKIYLIEFLTNALRALISISHKILKDVNKLSYKALSIFVCILTSSNLLSHSLYLTLYSTNKNLTHIHLFN